MPVISAFGPPPHPLSLVVVVGAVVVVAAAVVGEGQGSWLPATVRAVRPCVDHELVWQLPMVVTTLPLKTSRQSFGRFKETVGGAGNEKQRPALRLCTFVGHDDTSSIMSATKTGAHGGSGSHDVSAVLTTAVEAAGGFHDEVDMRLLAGQCSAYCRQCYLGPLSPSFP